MNTPYRQILAFPLLLVGCAMAPSSSSVPATPMAGWEAGLGRPGAVLYGRDGSPVGAADMANQAATNMPTLPGPTVTQTEDMPHRPVESGGSRPVLLELFQEAVAERDDLSIALETTRMALRETEDRVTDMEDQLTLEMQARQASELKTSEAEAQMFEMGKRLAVAQMRRLEAEKMLLEKTLAERRKMVEAAE